MKISVNEHAMNNVCFCFHAGTGRVVGVVHQRQ